MTMKTTGAPSPPKLFGEHHAEKERGRNDGGGNRNEKPRAGPNIEAEEANREGERHSGDLHRIHHVIEPFTCWAARSLKSGELAVRRVECVPDQEQQGNRDAQPP